MIVRRHLRLDKTLKFSWKNILFSSICGGLACIAHHYLGIKSVFIPPAVVAILGTALAIILGFRNSAGYERWWEAREIWGGIASESRTFTRQAMTIVDPKNYSDELWEVAASAVKQQLAWVNAMRLQLRGITDPGVWIEDVGQHLSAADFEMMLIKENRVTHIGMINGNTIKELQAHDSMDIFSYIQMDDTITRLTGLQGRAEKIKNTPLPRPYDYYTLAFLGLFTLLFPFAFIGDFTAVGMPWGIAPVTVVVSWFFYQLYAFGYALSNPFENFDTDVPLDAICREIEIDLKEVISVDSIPAKLQAVDGVLT